MKLLNKVLVTAILLPFLAGTIPVSVAKADTDFAWILKEIIDYDISDKIAEANRKRKGVYSTEANYAQGSYSSKKTYVGPDRNSPKMDGGEHLAVRADWSPPPAVIYPSAAVQLTLSFAVVSKSLPYLHFSNSTNAAFDVATIKPGFGTAGRAEFTDTNGVSHFKLDRGPVDSINKTLTAEAPARGKQGDLMALMIVMSTSPGSMGTKYIYAWTAINQESVKTAKNIAAPPPPAKKTSRRHIRKYAVPKVDGEYVDSGVRFSDLSGEVLIRRGDQRLGWEAADLDIVIYEGDIIWTKEEAGCILGLSDMTIFQMKPQSEIIISATPKEKHKLIFLMGKVITNVKKMLEDGTIDIEMSQAMAGARGTIFVVEENPEKSTSTLKVLEGKVEFAATNGETIVVTNSEMISAVSGKLGKVEKFSALEELTTWDASMQLSILESLIEKNVFID